MTVGERAEDVFYITDLDGRALSEERAGRLREMLNQTLKQRAAA